jgi:carbon monoxide dehydrogenase subunit G
VQIENRFTVPTPPETLWATLLDVERIAPCMPGAELTETIDDHTWKGKVLMKLGPVSLSFAGTVTIEERDDAAHRIRLRAKGMEQKGKGAANATITSWLERSGEETAVVMLADIQLTGAVAQLSRGLLPEVSRRLTQQFAECLHETMLGDAGTIVSAGGRADTSTPGVADDASTADAGGDSTPPPLAAPEPGGAGPPPSTRAGPKGTAIGGIRLGLLALWAALVNALRRLLDRR